MAEGQINYALVLLFVAEIHFDPTVHTVLDFSGADSHRRPADCSKLVGVSSLAPQRLATLSWSAG
jgi:hypothetical protein